jgi:hypothetical protein
VTVKLTYYAGLAGGGTATFSLRGPDDRELAEVEGPVRDALPQTLLAAPKRGPIPYPLYEVVVINGITEVIEHREKGALFYVTDDVNVNRILRVTNRSRATPP